MQSIASILEKEANFVVIFNEATQNNHQFGGYPNEQYNLYMKYGDEFMADKWGCEKIGTEENVDVWQEMLDIAVEILQKGFRRRRQETNTVDEYPSWAEIGSAVEKGMNR